MADEEGSQAPVLHGAQDPPVLQNPPPSPTPKYPPPPQNPNIPIVPIHQTPYIPPLNWSHFKPEYSGKPDEDAEAHLLRTNDWMDTHKDSKTTLRYIDSV